MCADMNRGFVLTLRVPRFRLRDTVLAFALSVERSSSLHRGAFLLHFAPTCVREHPESSRKLQVPLDQNL
jgi:hypothetical protein